MAVCALWQASPSAFLLLGVHQPRRRPSRASVAWSPFVGSYCAASVGMSNYRRTSRRWSQAA
jgi:hypothetical protein